MERGGNSYQIQQGGQSQKISGSLLIIWIDTIFIFGIYSNKYLEDPYSVSS